MKNYFYIYEKEFRIWFVSKNQEKNKYGDKLFAPRQNKAARAGALRFGQARRFGSRRRLDGGAVRSRIFEGDFLK